MDGGGPAGVKELEADGGTPEGVVDRLLNKLRDFPGVDGGLDSYGVLKDILCRQEKRGEELGR